MIVVGEHTAGRGRERRGIPDFLHQVNDAERQSNALVVQAGRLALPDQLDRQPGQGKDGGLPHLEPAAQHVQPGIPGYLRGRQPQLNQ